MTSDERDLSAVAALLNQFSVKDELVKKLNVEDEVLEKLLKLVGAMKGKSVTNSKMIEEYLQVGDGFDGFVIDSVFMTNLRRRLTDDKDSNPFGRLVRDGQNFDKDSSEESEKGDEARRPEEGQEEKEREKTKHEGDEKEEERQTLERMNKEEEIKKLDEEIRKLDEEIKKEDEMYEKKKIYRPPIADESWEKIQNWLLLFACDFSCNIVVGKIPGRGTSDLLETIQGKFLTDVIKSTKAEFMNGTYRGNRRDFLWKFVSEKTEDELLDINHIIKVFVVAMTVTVFTNLTWFFRLISIHTIFQKKMDINGIGEWKNHSLLNNLSYLEACISEAIRLFPIPKATIESLRENSKKTEIKNDWFITVRKEETMQDKPPEMFIPGRWVDGTGCYVGLSRKEEEEEELYSPSVKKIVHIVVKCVAIEVLSKIKVIDDSEEKMKMKWINIEKRRAKIRVIQKKREKEKLHKEMKDAKSEQGEKN